MATYISGVAKVGGELLEGKRQQIDLSDRKRNKSVAGVSKIETIRTRLAAAPASMTPNKA